MARRGNRTKTALVAIIIVLAAVVTYTLVPYVVSTKVSNLKSGQQTYVYGTVEKRYANNNVAAFELNDGSGNVWVIWNGTVPSDGSKVLVHGTYQQSSLLVLNIDDFKATSVTSWPV